MERITILFFFEVKYIFTFEWINALSYGHLLGIPFYHKGVSWLICPVPEPGDICPVFSECMWVSLCGYPYISTGLFYLRLSFSVNSFLSPSFVSATQTDSGHPLALIWDNSLAFCHRLVMFDSAAQGF